MPASGKTSPKRRVSRRKLLKGSLYSLISSYLVPNHFLWAAADPTITFNNNVNISKCSTDEQVILNLIRRSLTPTALPLAHSYNGLWQGDVRSQIATGWSLPLIGKGYIEKPIDRNTVTFIFKANGDASEVYLSGSPTDDQPIQMHQLNYLGATKPYYYVSLNIPFGQIHRYKFIVNGTSIVDPNSYIRKRVNGFEWSVFYTDAYQGLVTLNEAEAIFLDSIVSAICPFQLANTNVNFGQTNYIDKILSRQEHHHLINYKICLPMMHQALSQQTVSVELIADYLKAMESGEPNHWDYQRYNSPKHFLNLLRRHSVEGSFSHPKYGGNRDFAGWRYLEQQYGFDWKRFTEQPFGTERNYFG
ncbi:MAG: gluconate 2-dehydrogenase subunit 3 family protein [Pseudobacteriovorax sp.]|nr:gluconate 2-dehydrogenase subunit 3 family protein [Pseudobacteriovorax sp.]